MCPLIHCTGKPQVDRTIPSSLAPLFPSVVAITRLGQGREGRGTDELLKGGAVNAVAEWEMVHAVERASSVEGPTDADESLFTIRNPFTRRRTIVKEPSVWGGRQFARPSDEFRWTTTKYQVLPIDVRRTRTC